MQDYTRNLIIEEMHLGPLIERAVKAIEEDKEKEKELEESENGNEDESFENSLFNTSTEDFLKDQDFTDFRESEEEDLNLDQEFYDSLKKNGT